MDLDGPLRAHASLKVERPPTLWEAETEVEPFLALLGQMIALGLGRGNELGDLTLNVSNVVLEPDEDDEEAEQVAVTVATDPVEPAAAPAPAPETERVSS